MKEDLVNDYLYSSCYLIPAFGMAYSEVSELTASLSTYKTQLAQVESALLDTDDESLLSLASSLRELIQLTEHSIDEHGSVQTSNPAVESNTAADAIDHEFALFQAEMAQLEKGESMVEDVNVPDQPEKVEESVVADIKSSLLCMVGKACSAPYIHSWGQMEYHSAIIEGVEDISSLNDSLSTDDIKVRVLFSHPTHSAMLPCRFYLRQSCQYGPACGFSHGHAVPLSQVTECPCEDTLEMCPGAEVLVRRLDNEDLWHRARVISLHPDTGQVTVDTASGSSSASTAAGSRQLALSDVAALPASSQPSSRSCDDGIGPEDDGGGGAGDEDAAPCSSSVSVAAVEDEPEVCDFRPVVAWQNINCTDRLASWEKYTTGIGSRLMREMGYVIGTGLGRNAEGRVEPVEATVYPVGKSLDHCMRLREGLEPCRGGALMSVERVVERDKRRQESASERVYQRRRRHNAVFDVINQLTRGSDKHSRKRPRASSPSPSPPAASKPMSAASLSELGRQDLRLSEEIRSTERDVRRLSSGSERNPGASGDAIRSQLAQCRQRLGRLRAAETRLDGERRRRVGSRRLDVF